MHIAIARTKVIFFILACLLVFSINALYALNVTFIGTSDSAYYAQLGKSVGAGKGFTIDTIGYFIVHYPKTITHPDEVHDPLQPILLAILFKLFGTAPAVAIIPSMIFAFILTPILTWRLARKFVSENWALLAGIFTLLNPLHQALYGWSEPMFTMLTTAGILLFVKSTKDPKYYVYTGVILGLAGLTRRSGYFFILFFII